MQEKTINSAPDQAPAVDNLPAMPLGPVSTSSALYAELAPAAAAPALPVPVPFWYKKWWVLALIGGALTATVGTTVYIVRRHRQHI